MKLQATPMGIFGARVSGWDFDAQAEESDNEQLRQLLLQYKMLILPSQTLAPEQLLKLSRVFGTALAQSSDEQWWHSAEHKNIYRITNQPSAVQNCACESWHCDGHYLPDPMGITIMNQVAAAGGHIAVADLSLPFEQLPQQAKLILSKMRCKNLGSGVIQPLVIRHPATGRFGFYVNMYARTIDPSGNFAPQVDELLDKLLENYTYMHEWQSGDIMLIDNLAVVHKACPGPPQTLEVLHRCQTHLSGTWWQQRPAAAQTCSEAGAAKLPATKANPPTPIAMARSKKSSKRRKDRQRRS